MPTFRNTETGVEFKMGERWAKRIRSQPHLVELTTEGIEIPKEPSPLPDPALASMRKADLAAILAEANQSTDGSKAELLARVIDISAARATSGDPA